MRTILWTTLLGVALPLSAAIGFAEDDAPAAKRPTPEQSAAIAKYIEQLASDEYALREAASTKLVEYGKSSEGRSLNYLVISSAANMAKLDELRANILKLGDPRVTDAREADGRTPFLGTAQVRLEGPATLTLRLQVLVGEH